VVTIDGDQEKLGLSGDLSNNTCMAGSRLVSFVPFTLRCEPQIDFKPVGFCLTALLARYPFVQGNAYFLALKILFCEVLVHMFGITVVSDRSPFFRCCSAVWPEFRSTSRSHRRMVQRAEGGLHIQ
jgi:hypothetical protein